MSDLREELVKLLGAILLKHQMQQKKLLIDSLTDDLLPFVQAQVDAAVNAEYSKMNDEITAAVDAAVRAERERGIQVIAEELVRQRFAPLGQGGLPDTLAAAIRSPNWAEERAQLVAGTHPKIAAVIREGEKPPGDEGHPIQRTNPNDWED